MHRHETERDGRDASPETGFDRLAAERAWRIHRIVDPHHSIHPAHTAYLQGVAPRKLALSVGVVVASTPERAFDYFADHRHVAQVLDGVSAWEPIGPRTKGVGARFAVEMKALGFPLKSTLRLNRWRRPHEIGWTSESGLIKQDGSFTFTKSPKGVRIVLDIAYVPPASFVGEAVAARLDGFVRRRLAVAMERIRATLERGTDV